MWNKFLVIFLILIFLGGCSWIGPKEFSPDKPQSLKLEKTEAYDVDLSKFDKPDSLDPLFVDKDFKEVSPENASYVVFTPQEFNKVRVIVKLAKNYKKIILKQEELVNLKIDIINKYKDQLELEREKAIEYRNLWVNTENRRREEKWNNEIQDYLDKAGLVALVAAIIVISL